MEISNLYLVHCWNNQLLYLTGRQMKVNITFFLNYFYSKLFKSSHSFNLFELWGFIRPEFNQDLMICSKSTRILFKWSLFQSENVEILVWVYKCTNSLCINVYVLSILEWGIKFLKSSLGCKWRFVQEWNPITPTA